MREMWPQEMPERQAAALRQAVARHAHGLAGVEYPAWYFRRWHFLPEGYLSGRSVWLYDRLIRPVYWAGSEGRAARLLGNWLRRTGARRVLEVAPGPGRLLKRLQRALPMVDFRAIELSPYFVAMARERCGSEQIVHGNGLHLEQVAGVFDAVIAAHYVGHAPENERERVLKAMANAARQGGTVALVEHRWHGWDVPRELRLRATRRLGFSTLHIYRRESAQGGAA